MKKILFIFGTRPEAMKMAPLIKETGQSRSLGIEICVTGQHREMLDQVLKLFDICPDYDLNIMQPGQDLYDITSRILINLRDVLQQSKPDLVLVHGDTTTSMAAALAAFYQQIPVGHIEAGLRTHQPYNPWPEEMNRQVTDRICTYYFAPTEQSRANLLQENIDAKKIFITGNTVIDALLMAVDIISTTAGVKEKMAKDTAAGSGRYRIGDNALAHEGPGRVVDGHQSAVGSGHAAAGALGAGRAAPHQPHRLFAAGSGPLGILTGRAGHDHQLVHLRTLVKGPDAPFQDSLTAQIEAQFIKSHPGGRTSRHQNCRHTTFQFLTPAPFYSCPAPHCTERIIIH